MNHNVLQQSHIYQQLDLSTRQIRLLQVSEGVPNNPIHCDLLYTSLSEAQFVVLSYRWGSEDATHEISLNGQPFFIRPNLWEFLNVIRKQNGMLLWIDALCINQMDPVERSQQVRIMGDIFKSASMVVSWLGPAQESTSTIGHAFDLMSHVWESSLSEISSENICSEQGQKYDLLPRLEPNISEDDSWRCVANLCNLKYWDRAWVVQEILLSANNCLLYGDKMLGWQMFANFLTLIDVRFKCPTQYSRTIHNSTAKSYALSKPYKTLRHNFQWRMGNERMHSNSGRAWDIAEYSLFRILSMFGHRECTVPLDHVYALLSLTSEGMQFPINYGISTSRLFALVFYYCAETYATQHPASLQDDVFWPSSQRAFFRNAKHLAEIMELVFSHDKTLPYFPGMGLRAPHPKPDPCWPREFQKLMLSCSIVQPGNEPPLLRSHTLQQRLAEYSFDLLLHLEESTSWLLCQRQLPTENLLLTAIVTIKDNMQGRGFKILDASSLSMCPVVPSRNDNSEQKWQLAVGPGMHLNLLAAVIFGEQPV